MSRTFPTAAFSAGLAALMALGCSDNAGNTSADTVNPAVADVEVDASRGANPPTLTPQQSGTTNRLQAVSPVNSQVVWASGVGGTYVLTTDGGNTWKAGVVPGAETLQFRDVEGVSDKVAYLLAAGVGSDSRIYKTEDGGANWALQFQATDPAAFYDCFSFWSRNRGLTFGDAIGTRFPTLRTRNGSTWDDIGNNMPAALPGEFAFAASGTCIATQGEQNAWATTGGTDKARVLATTNGGRSWNAYDAPIVAGPAGGGFSIAFRDARRGILVGGDLENDGTTENVAVSRDGGKSWTLASPTPFPGAAYGAAYVDDGAPGHSGLHGRGRGHGHKHGDRSVVATGPGGAAYSHNEGGTWTLIPDVANYWAVAFAGCETGWFVGTDGRILKIEF